MRTAPRNPHCTAIDGKSCSFCSVNWWEPHPLSRRAVPTAICIQEQGSGAPRRVSEEDGSYNYCNCNHCYGARKELRAKEERAASMLADALEFALSEESGFACPAATEERMRAALKAAGRLP